MYLVFGDVDLGGRLLDRLSGLRHNDTTISGIDTVESDKRKVAGLGTEVARRRRLDAATGARGGSVL